MYHVCGDQEGWQLAKRCHDVCEGAARNWKLSGPLHTMQAIQSEQRCFHCVFLTRGKSDGKLLGS